MAAHIIEEVPMKGRGSTNHFIVIVRGVLAIVTADRRMPNAGGGYRVTICPEKRAGLKQWQIISTTGTPRGCVAEAADDLEKKLLGHKIVAPASRQHGRFHHPALTQCAEQPEVPCDG